MGYSEEEIARRLSPRLDGPGLTHPDFAVAIPLVTDPAGIRLLIEVRARGISQAGDPCFPGGRIEPGETPKAAALRELREELGIGGRLLPGQLPTVDTPLGLRTDLLVCLVSPEEASRARPNPAEVAVLLRPLFDRFLSGPGRWAYDVEGHRVWGMTAGAIGQLCRAWREAGLD